MASTLGSSVNSPAMKSIAAAGLLLSGMAAKGGDAQALLGLVLMRPPWFMAKNLSESQDSSSADRG